MGPMASEKEAGSRVWGLGFGVWVVVNSVAPVCISSIQPQGSKYLIIIYLPKTCTTIIITKTLSTQLLGT